MSGRLRQRRRGAVKIHRVGICGTDIHAYRGKMPFLTYPRILGHELGVEVIDGGRRRGKCEGRRPLRRGAVFELRHVHCMPRRQNQLLHSLQVLGVHTDGGMRDYITVPAHKLHPANDLSFEQLALIETLGIGCHAVDRGQLQKDEWVLVIGCGPIGLTVLQFAQLATKNIIVMDVNPTRLDFASEHFQIAHALRADHEPLKRIEEITNGDLPTAVFDATGNAQSMMDAFKYVAHGGRLDLRRPYPGRHHLQRPILSSPRDHAAGDAQFHRAEFHRIIAGVRSGEVDTRAWVTHRAPAAEMIGAFDGWLKPEAGVVKAGSLSECGLAHPDLTGIR